ncbi:hypothetical protein HJC23_000756 [Cyclotella cryptica]|uniref:Uncharacterized protein n=1 Tax=Cyclotella cryptica TaxID=29204 RepID=A0ABD3Q021_9STRA|eukprot:CCRYP_010136-RA/>CCRYP_010136-RA protein AED:0.40 eAED:0.40 QI:0/-1/0/1/-1/1/1/0/224
MTRLGSQQQQEHLYHDGNYTDQDFQLFQYEWLKLDVANDTQPQTSPADIVMQGNQDNSEHDESMPFAEIASIEDMRHALSIENPKADHDIFAFSRLPYINAVRSWTTTGKVIDGYDPPPAMISSSDADDTMSSSSGGSDDDGVIPVSKGVTFNETVRVMPIPPVSAYTVEQRFRMYANRFELRENKLRNKKEFQFDGYDWRNATEECHMAICPRSGELLHPAHL